jgi:hypothetical protein
MHGIAPRAMASAATFLVSAPACRYLADARYAELIIPSRDQHTIDIDPLSAL